jgi:hypothetical protein
MAHTITKTVYDFGEVLALHEQGKVTKRAVEKARAWLVEGQTDHDWWEYVYDLWKKALDQIGFENAEIAFSGFWSQGDGASFTASVDVVKLATFMGTQYQAADTIQASNDPGGEDYRGWVIRKIGGKSTDAKYLKLVRVAGYIDANAKRTTHHSSHENTCAFEADLRDTGQVGSGPEYRWNSDQPRLRAMFEGWVQDAEALRVDLCQAIYLSLEQEYESLTSDESLTELSAANGYTFDETGRRDG